MHFHFQMHILILNYPSFRFQQTQLYNTPAKSYPLFITATLGDLISRDLVVHMTWSGYPKHGVYPFCAASSSIIKTVLCMYSPFISISNAILTSLRFQR
jgi:hypothetical protein